MFSKLHSGREWGATRSAARSPKIQDIVWAAGFLEGEGSFHSVKRDYPGCVQVSAVQVNRQPLERLLAMFGGTIRTVKRRRAQWNQASVWVATGSRGRGIALTLYPLMSDKRKEQIRSAFR